MSMRERLLCKTYKKTSHAKSKDDGQGWIETMVNDTLNAFDNGESRTPTLVLENHPADSRVTISKDNIVQTLSGRMETGGGNTPMVMESKEPIAYWGDAITSPTNASKPIPGLCHTLIDDNRNYLVEKNMETVVRRLTPLECERLQGFPDGWTDIGEWTDSKGKKHKDADSPRYKALGNSIALPFWEWMAERICKQYDRPITMASLFDGIGGFPLAFQRHGCTPVWASEIEEFPIAVTKIRFPEDDKGESSIKRITKEMLVLGAEMPTERTGHWELLSHELYMCSECYAKWTMKLKYCPNCGARMVVSE